MERRVAVVTGATGAIGRAIARRLLEADMEVVVPCRDERRGRALAEALGPRARYEPVDLARADSIAALGARWTGPLHVLVNCAAVAPRRRTEAPDGTELQLAVNVLAYLRMTRALEPALRSSAPARVVDVASYWAGSLDLDDLEFARRPYDNDAAYRQSKQANRMLVVAEAPRLAPAGIAINACHPGDVPSRLASDLGFGGHETADQAADTPAWLALDPAVVGSTGRWFRDRRQHTCRFASDRAAIQALHDRCSARLVRSPT